MTNTKQTAKHTAGEWTKHENKDGSFDVCGQHGKRSESDVIAYKVLPHNARLIASAPELLSALEKLHEEYAHQGKGYWTGTGQAVERLIAKAKGE